MELLLESSGVVRGLLGSGSVLRVSLEVDCGAGSPGAIVMVVIFET